MDKLRQFIGRKADASADDTPRNAEVQTQPTQDKEAGRPSEVLEKNIDDAEPDPGAQLGVQKIEAVTLTWGKKWLAALLIK